MLKPLLVRTLSRTFLAASPLLKLRDTGERYIEMPFTLANLPFPPCKVLDVGCCDSSFSILMSWLGYDVTAVDVRPFNRSEVQLRDWKAADRVRYIQGDISKIPELPDNSFDAVTIISTLEHIGVGGRYGVEDNSGLDNAAIREMARLVKPGGTVIITVPFGRKKLIAPLCRIYDAGLIESAEAAGLVCERKEFFIQEPHLRWRRAAMRDAELRDVQVETYCLALLKLVKQSGSQ